MKIKKGYLRCNITIDNFQGGDLINYLHEKGISIYNFNKINEKTAKICIDYADRRKFFAISKNMCYNIKKESYKGFFSPLIYAFQYFGLFLGIIFSIFLSLYVDNILLDIKCVGSGACFSSKIIQTINDCGIKKYSKFSLINLKELQSIILSSNENLSFVTCEKSGNTLIVNSVLNVEGQGVLQQSIKDIVSDYSGVIDKIEVLRGTPLVNVGDSVSVGDKLVGAYVTSKEGEIFPTYVIASVVIITQEEFVFKFDSVSEELVKIAEMTAKFNCDGEVVGAKSIVIENTVKVIVSVKKIVDGS